METVNFFHKQDKNIFSSLLLRRFKTYANKFRRAFRYWRYFLPPELLNSFHEFVFVPWLHFRFLEELELVPQVFDWVEVGTFWGSTPPVDVLFLEEGLCSPGHVLWVIVLSEPVIGKLFSDKGHKGRLQDVAKEISIHDAFKDTNLCGTMSANSSPDMNF